MTISATATSKQFPCNGLASQFSFPNKIFNASDLAVTLMDTQGNLYPFSNFSNVAAGLTYTVQNVDVDNGCLVVMSAPPIFGWTLDVRSNTPDLQSTSIKNQSAFLPELHEEAFDKSTRQVQDLLRITYTYGIHGPDIEATPWPALPSAAARAGMAIVFDSNGLPRVGAVPTTTFTQTIFNGFLAGANFPYPQTALEASLGIVPINFTYPSGTLDRYQLNVSPGTTDMSVAWQDALNTGYVNVTTGNTYYVATGATLGANAPLTVTGYGTIICDGNLLTAGTLVGGGCSNALIENITINNLTAPWIITRNPANWAANVLGTLAQSNGQGYQPTVNDQDLWGSLTLAQQNQQIGPVITFQGAALNITVRNIRGRFARVSIMDATDSQFIDNNIRGGKGNYGALIFDNVTNQLQRGARNRAQGNKVQYASFTGVTFLGNDDGFALGNYITLGGESGIKTYQANGVIFTASAGGATSATLSSGSLSNGTWTFQFSDTEVRTVTVAGTALTWSGALAAGNIVCASAWQGTINPQCFRMNISQNHCWECYYDGIDASSTNATNCDSAVVHSKVEGNYCYNNGGDGINVIGQDISCKGNFVYGNYRFGIWGLISQSAMEDNRCTGNNTSNSGSQADILAQSIAQIGSNKVSNNFVAFTATSGFPIYAPQVTGETPNKTNDNFCTPGNGTGATWSIQAAQTNNIDANTGYAADQGFTFVIENVGGVLQHAFYADITLAAGGLQGKVIGASSGGFTATPTGTDASTAFAAGAKISTNATNAVVLNVNPQFMSNVQISANLVENNTGTATFAAAWLQSFSVNGVTQMRLLIGFYNATTGAAIPITTGNLASGKIWAVQFNGKLA